MMNQTETSLILEMLRGIQNTQGDHGEKIDKIKDLSVQNSNDIANIKADIMAIHNEQKKFIRKPNLSSFNFWVKLGGGIVAAIFVGYQTFKEIINIK